MVLSTTSRTGSSAGATRAVTRRSVASNQVTAPPIDVRHKTSPVLEKRVMRPRSGSSMPRRVPPSPSYAPRAETPADVTVGAMVSEPSSAWTTMMLSSPALMT